MKEIIFNNSELVIDNFAGGGGASTGIERAIGRPVDLAINHNRQAVLIHKMNHPATVHLCEDLWSVDPELAVNGHYIGSGQQDLFDHAEACAARLRAGLPVGLAWFSPDCTHFSKAKGGKPRKKRIRGLAWIVVKWAMAVRPRIIMLENVEEFREWGPLTKENMPCPLRKGKTFARWRNKLVRLGYQVECKVLNAADYGAPTSRKRLFLVARCDGQPIVWPTPTHGPGRPNPYRTAGECIDWSIPCPSIFERPRPLAENTLRRIAKGIKKFVIENPQPFIIPYYGDKSESGCRAKTLDQPLPTQTTENRFGLVVPSIIGIDNKSNGDGSAWSAGEPLRTITKENRFAVATAFLAKHYTGVTGQTMEQPIGTVTAKDHHSLVTAFLTKFYGTNVAASLEDPAPTITGQGQHLGEVRAFLVKYYGQGDGQELFEPMHTITSHDRFGLVMVHGQPYVIADIGLRMLSPEELLLAQGFPSDYRLIGTKSQKVAMIGNSVSPYPAEALVRANYTEVIRQEKTA